MFLGIKAMTNLCVCVCVCVKSLNCVWLFATLWTVAHQAPLSMGFSRQEYWSGLPFPSPGDLPNPGIEPGSPALQADALSSEPPGKPKRHIKNQRHYFTNKGPSGQSYGFSSNHVWMWELDYKESWVPKNWCFWTVVLEKAHESPLDFTEIQPVHPKGNQSWIFIRRTDAEAETTIFWPPDAKNRLIGKDPNWERLKAGGEGGPRGWNSWMASPMQRIWVWVNSGNWWLTGRAVVLQSMGWQRVSHDWAAELNWEGYLR